MRPKLLKTLPWIALLALGLVWQLLSDLFSFVSDEATVSAHYACRWLAMQRGTKTHRTSSNKWRLPSCSSDRVGRA
jgi:hypothetical protein